MGSSDHVHEVTAVSDGEHFRSLMPSTTDEVTAVSEGNYFRSKAKPFPIYGPKHFHHCMVTTSEHPGYQDNNDDDGNSDTSLDDDGKGNTFRNTQGTPLTTRNKPRLAESGLTQLI